MKKIIICLVIGLCLAGTPAAFAGENLVNVVWETDVYLGTEGGSDYYAQLLDLDIGLTKYYLTVNGAITVDIGGSIPCTGTGFTTAADDYFLGMQCGVLTINALIDGQNLDGTIDVYLGDTDISFGTLTFDGMY